MTKAQKSTVMEALIAYIVKACSDKATEPEMAGLGSVMMFLANVDGIVPVDD